MRTGAVKAAFWGRNVCGLYVTDPHIHLDMSRMSTKAHLSSTVPVGADRPLLAIADNTIRGTHMVHIHCFLLQELRRPELGALWDKFGLLWYGDWDWGPFGPRSNDLLQDLNGCVDARLVARTDMSDIYKDRPKAETSAVYRLTKRGRARRGLMFRRAPEARAIAEAVASYQKAPASTLIGQLAARRAR